MNNNEIENKKNINTPESAGCPNGAELSHSQLCPKNPVDATASPKIVARKRWEQLDGEPDQLYRTFTQYLSLGPSRSYSKIALLTGVHKQTIYHWSNKYFWLKRAEEYDKNKFLQLKDAIMEANSGEVKQNVRNTIDLTNRATSIISSLISSLESFNELYDSKEEHRRLNYLILACRAVRQLRSVISFAPFSRSDADFAFEGAIMNYLEDAASLKNKPEVAGASTSTKRAVNQIDSLLAAVEKVKPKSITRNFFTGDD